MAASGLDPMFAGCGSHISLNESYQYGLINQWMHNGMAINFTGNPEYDFLAAMIPHHEGASRMCDVYLNSAQHLGGGGNRGIQSLCYNITYGAKSWGQWQSDFSQPGEIKQMKDALQDLGMLHHYEQGCKSLTDLEKCQLAQASGHGMYMGCGNLHSSMAKEYLTLNMGMHTLMALDWTGNADIDFLLGMIPHHEAAISMCDIYYEYWTCAPAREVCRNPLPFEKIQTMISSGQTVDILNQLHHMCTAHILETQPAEVTWMKKELARISPEAFAAYENRGMGYPCSSTSGHDHSVTMPADSCASLMNNSSNDSMPMPGEASIQAEPLLWKSERRIQLWWTRASISRISGSDC
eukprot:TRINITY_DN2396_c0_g5_i1.p1 TRINITY_DN2396_c0_g5~~TRINITY_DN2396_c0_g5_i1.p1  ORF type:complete len:391 (-),score=56.22 TRINITY_DN2396_c0_g5_i1:144-1199(-)